LPILGLDFFGKNFLLDLGSAETSNKVAIEKLLKYLNNIFSKDCFDFDEQRSI
jgi:hypothetical protein